MAGTMSGMGLAKIAEAPEQDGCVSIGSSLLGRRLVGPVSRIG